MWVIIAGRGRARGDDGNRHADSGREATKGIGRQNNVVDGGGGLRRNTQKACANGAGCARVRRRRRRSGCRAELKMIIIIMPGVYYIRNVYNVYTLRPGRRRGRRPDEEGENPHIFRTNERGSSISIWAPARDWRTGRPLSCPGPPNVTRYVCIYTSPPPLPPPTVRNGVPRTLPADDPGTTSVRVRSALHTRAAHVLPMSAAAAAAPVAAVSVAATVVDATIIARIGYGDATCKK